MCAVSISVIGQILCLGRRCFYGKISWDDDVGTRFRMSRFSFLVRVLGFVAMQPASDRG